MVFEEPGSIIIRFVNIHNPNLLALESTVVAGEVEQKALRTVEFTAVAYANPEKSEHEEFHIDPAPRLEFYYELAILIILIPAALFVFVIFWIKKKPQILGDGSPPKG